MTVALLSECSAALILRPRSAKTMVTRTICKQSVWMGMNIHVSIYQTTLRSTVQKGHSDNFDMNVIPQILNFDDEKVRTSKLSIIPAAG